MTGTNGNVLIIGAGLGGLTAGIALVQRGFTADIFEQATLPLHRVQGVVAEPQLERGGFWLLLGQCHL